MRSVAASGSKRTETLVYCGGSRLAPLISGQVRSRSRCLPCQSALGSPRESAGHDSQIRSYTKRSTHVAQVLTAPAVPVSSALPLPLPAPPPDDATQSNCTPAPASQPETGTRHASRERAHPQQPAAGQASAPLEASSNGTKPGKHNISVDLGWSRSLAEEYDVGEQVAAGGFGIVRKAVQKATGKPVAVKQVSKSGSRLSGGSQPLDKVYLSSRDRAKLRRALESEVASLKRAQVSRNVVHLEGCFEDDASVYIVTEFCDGIDLASYVKEHGPLPESQAAAIIHECLEVLAVCHDKHILHGDIKPDNFMVRNAAAAAFVPASGAPQEDDRQPPHEQPAPASDQATAAATATFVPENGAHDVPENGRLPHTCAAPALQAGIAPVGVADPQVPSVPGPHALYSGPAYGQPAHASAQATPAAETGPQIATTATSQAGAGSADTAEPQAAATGTSQVGKAGPQIAAVDFGCSQVVPPGRILHEPRGTPAYTAPEVYTRKYNKMADMWSLGVTCYYLLTGTYPYWHDMEAQPPREVMKTIIRQPFHLQDDARLAHVSPECRDFLDRLLQHNLSRRLTAHAALNHAWVSQTLP